MKVPMRIDVYADTVCPWCFLALRRFAAALGSRPDLAPAVTLRSFELYPALPWDGAERIEYLAARVGGAARVAALDDELRRLGEEAGIAFRFDRIQRVPNSRRSHLLIAHAARRGLQSAVQERVMRAYFEEGVDVGDIEELVRLGVESGLSEHETRSALVLRVGQDAVIATERHADALGITVVPTFVFDGQYTLSGAQEPSHLIRVLDQVTEFAAARAAVP